MKDRSHNIVITWSTCIQLHTSNIVCIYFWFLHIAFSHTIGNNTPKIGWKKRPPGNIAIGPPSLKDVSSCAPTLVHQQICYSRYVVYGDHQTRNWESILRITNPNAECWLLMKTPCFFEDPGWMFIDDYQSHPRWYKAGIANMSMGNIYQPRSMNHNGKNAPMLVEKSPMLVENAPMLVEKNHQC